MPDLRSSQDPTDLLVALHNIVSHDRGPPGMKGNIAFGVDDGRQRVWLNVRFEPVLGATFDDLAALDVDAALLLGANEATAILRDGRLPDSPELAEIEGDRNLIEKFVRRYLVQSSSLDVRVQTSRDQSGMRKKKITSKKNGGSR